MPNSNVIRAIGYLHGIEETVAVPFVLEGYIQQLVYTILEA
jgi:hypothetical protein